MHTDELPNPNITTLDEYQTEAAKTAKYPPGIDLIYNLMGGGGEYAEYAKIVLGAIDRTIQEEGKKGSMPTDLMLVRQALFRAIEACSELERLKRPLREGKMSLSPVTLTDAESDRLETELGDRCWYIAGDARALKRRLSEIAQRNLTKLRARKEAGVLHGSGESVEERRRG